MRLSNEIVSGNEKNSKPFFAKVTSASASNVNVQADRECRNLKMQFPFGIVSTPTVGSKVVIIPTENECVLSGTVNLQENLEPGELMLYSSGGASIILKNNGKVLINGKEY